MATNVPQLKFKTQGIDSPNEQEILSGVQADQNTAFGGDLSDSLSSPQGQIAQSNTAIIGAKNDDILWLANNIDPDTASGRWQDAIGRIYFIDRIPGRATVVTGRCRGLVGTIIPEGAAAQDIEGYIYYSTARHEIGANGFVDVEFQCAEVGPIACPVGNLSQIYIKVSGWDSVENLTAGTIGADVESRAEFEARRRASVAINATGSVQAVQANVLAVDGVVDAYVTDNFEGEPAQVGSTGYEIRRNSVYVCVAGGDPNDIAEAIFKRKSLGCNSTGNQSVTVYDRENYATPYPEYEIRYQIAEAAQTFVSVRIADNERLPADIDQVIAQSVIESFNGEDGGQRARIGSSLYAGRFYGPIYRSNENVDILDISIGLSEESLGSSILYGIDQRPTLDVSNIRVVIE